MYLDNSPKRHPCNKKLRLFYEPSFNGCAIQYVGGFPMVTNYLEKLQQVIQLACYNYRRVYAVRIDLRFPQFGVNPALFSDNACLKKFFTYLQREIDASRLKYHTKVFYVWAREQNTSEHPHYHLLILLNYDSICGIGNYSQSVGGGYEAENLYHRMVRSWSKAIGVPSELAGGLVNICKKPFTNDIAQFAITNEYDNTQYDELFHAASYLCKAHTKNFAQQVHCFGSSQTRGLSSFEGNLENCTINQHMDW
ncbi:YagK/YfjJ domain-containing protein [Vibrio parahaemolyticus]|uniref:YagK/YfjJ domain-containing protein n=1 Tax=Vibrio parahaemolyticus TaxID=670 RepID=UPI00248BAB7D|nr:inovirus-type Gp2 protein [Vibrio parahaemolyticus]